jgi:hypothetical protein
MNNIFDTTKNRYLAGIQKDFSKEYFENYNEYMSQIERTLVLLFNEKEKMIGNGNLIECAIDGNKKIDFLITAAHVIEEALKESKKIKVPINYEIYNKYLQENNCAVLNLNEDNCFINRGLDYGIILGFSNLKNENYNFIPFDNNISSPLLNEHVLIFGINERRIKKSIRKSREMQNTNIPVYTLQLSTKIYKIDTNTFSIYYPTKMYFAIDGNFNNIMKGRPQDPHCLSGSLVWIYDKHIMNPKIVGLISEKTEDNQGIRCIRIDKILNDMKGIS